MGVEEYNRNPQAGAAGVQPTKPGAGVQVHAPATVAAQPGTVAEAHEQSTSEAQAQGGPGNEAY